MPGRASGRAPRRPGTGMGQGFSSRLQPPRGCGKRLEAERRSGQSLRGPVFGSIRHESKPHGRLDATFAQHPPAPARLLLREESQRTDRLTACRFLLARLHFFCVSGVQRRRQALQTRNVRHPFSFSSTFSAIFCRSLKNSVRNAFLPCRWTVAPCEVFCIMPGLGTITK